MIGAAKEDDVGKYAKGAMDRLLAGSREALASIEDAASRWAGGDVNIFLVKLMSALVGLFRYRPI